MSSGFGFQKHVRTHSQTVHVRLGVGWCPGRSSMPLSLDGPGVKTDKVHRTCRTLQPAGLPVFTTKIEDTISPLHETLAMSNALHAAALHAAEGRRLPETASVLQYHNNKIKKIVFTLNTSVTATITIAITTITTHHHPSPPSPPITTHHHPHHPSPPPPPNPGGDGGHIRPYLRVTFAPGHIRHYLHYPSAQYAIQPFKVEFGDKGRL